jgi:hypothetical protein
VVTLLYPGSLLIVYVRRATKKTWALASSLLAFGIRVSLFCCGPALSHLLNFPLGWSIQPSFLSALLLYETRFALSSDFEVFLLDFFEDAGTCGKTLPHVPLTCSDPASCLSQIEALYLPIVTAFREHNADGTRCIIGKRRRSAYLASVIIDVP